MMVKATKVFVNVAMVAASLLIFGTIVFGY